MVHEQLSEQFYEWEARGRGWRVFDEPVSPEPPFLPFHGHYLPDTPIVDDGRKPTFLSAFVRKLSEKLGNQPAPPAIPETEEEPEPQPLTRQALIELQTSLPAKLNISRDAFEQFLLNLSLCREPVAFELLGTPGKVSAQFAACPEDAPLLRRQLQAHFPEAVFQPSEGGLQNAWDECEGDGVLTVEFGLAREFMFTLASGKLDPFIGIIGALSELQPGELGLFQVLFKHVEHPWAESILRSVTDTTGAPFFVNQPELAGEAKTKIARSLYAAVVRIAARSEQYERTLQIARDLAGSLRVFARPNGNELIPLSNEDYPFDDHIEDVLRRQSRRAGMILNADELIGFVHLPTEAVRSPIFQRESGKTKAPPEIVCQSSGVFFGNNAHAGQSVAVKLTPEQRVRHLHVIGASGTGKSTLLYNLIRQDIENGEGVAVFDPHGDLVDRILGVIPPARIGDVVLVNPADEQYSVGFNFLLAHSDLEKNLLASDLVSAFQRLSTSWGDQMNSVLGNAIRAFLESSRGGTLSDLRRFLIEPAFRTEFLKTVADTELLYYWQKGFPQLSGNKSIGPVLTRLETFLAPKPIRYMVSQSENRLDFAQIMDSGKIFLAKLSQGMLGKENSYLLGTLLVSKFQQLAMARQAQEVGARRNFWMYVDEFHNFITPSMAEILTGARKYRVGLVLAHQELRQLQRDAEVAGAVMSNPYARVVFRVGDEDARRLADGFSFFEARDLQNLETGHAIARVERSDFDFNLSIPIPDEPDPLAARARREEVITASRKKYAVPRAEIEAALRRAWDSEETKTKPIPKETQQRPPSPDHAPRIEIITPPSRVPASETIAPAEVPPPAPAPEASQPERAIVPAVSSEASPSETNQPSVSERKAPSRPADLGRGGAQHQAIQQRLKQAAEALGFRCVIEKRILEGAGSVDLLLERGDQVFACEISISTTVDHEVGNVGKCLKAGFPKVAVICTEEERLKKIAAAVAGSLGSEMAARIIYAQPDQFIARLKGIAEMPPPVPKAPAMPETRRGYKIKRSMPKLTPEEQKQREEAAVRSIAETMRRKS